MSANLALERLARVDACAASDALDFLGLDGVILGLEPLSVGHRYAGRAVTMQLVEFDGTPASRHLGTAAVDAAGEGDVIVVAHDGRTTVSGWGGVLSAGASRRGVAGVVVDGAVRDVDQAAEYGLPVHARTAVPRTARGRVVERNWNVPVVLAGVTVEPGDYVVADGSGVVRIPQSRIDEVLDIAERIVAKEELMAQRALAGEPMVDVMGRDYESMLDGARDE